MNRVIILSILYSLAFLSDAQAQYNDAYLNPYVNSSELRWLKSQKIDLSYTQINDKEFISNIRSLLNLKSQNNTALGKFSGLLAISIFSLLNYNLGDYSDSTGAFTNTLLGTVGVTSACLATKYFIEHKSLSSRRNQLLRLTRDQYKLAIQ